MTPLSGCVSGAAAGAVVGAAATTVGSTVASATISAARRRTVLLSAVLYCIEMSPYRTRNENWNVTLRKPAFPALPVRSNAISDEM
jgi:hypothetical protein